MFDSEEKPRPKGHEMGVVLDAMSIEELEARIALLEAEIDRLQQAISERQKQRNAAEALFKG